MLQTAPLPQLPSPPLIDDSTSRQGRVLVVDDDLSLVRAFARLLSSAGHSVLTAGDGRAAIDALRRERFDAVLTDVSMPGMSGLELLRAVRETDLDVPVVLVSGEPTVAAAAEAVEYGAFRYLTKPVELPALEEAISRAVQQRRLADLRRSAVTVLGTERLQVGDLAGLEASFERALRGLFLVFQPIVSLGERRILAHEALLRSTEPSLPDVGAVLTAGE